jgi:hypothetical protein
MLRIFRNLCYSLPLVFVAGHCLIMAWFQLSAVDRYSSMAREFREDFPLYSGLSGVHNSVSLAYTAVVILCTMLIMVVGWLLNRLQDCEDRLVKLEVERRRREDASL